jgi:hypothetical protein
MAVAFIATAAHAQQASDKQLEAVSEKGRS